MEHVLSPRAQCQKESYRLVPSHYSSGSQVTVTQIIESHLVSDSHNKLHTTTLGSLID